MRSLWSQLINTFEVSTRGSRRKMLRIANHHYSRLLVMQADATILAMLLIFEPAILLYRSMFSTLDGGEGTSVGNTAKWKQLLDEMANVWFDDWQTMVRPIFGPKTPDFIAIFPRGKEPFQSIEYDMRMVAVDGLYKKLANYPALSAVAADVAAKLVLLQDARGTQEGGFGTNVFTASMIEEQRLVLANLLDDNLGGLKKKYRTNIKMVENYYDLAELRRTSTDADSYFTFNGAVEAGMTAAVQVSDKLTLSANATCSFSNKSNTVELAFFLSPNASAADNTIKTSVLNMQTVQTTAAESGWAPGANFLIVKNLGTVTAEFEGSVTEAIEG